jgi:hypothetical protein
MRKVRRRICIEPFEKDVANRKAPNSKHQAPNNDQSPNNQNFRKDSKLFRDWSFGIGDYLGFEIW